MYLPQCCAIEQWNGHHYWSNYETLQFRRRQNPFAIWHLQFYSSRSLFSLEMYIFTISPHALLEKSTTDSIKIWQNNIVGKRTEPFFSSSKLTLCHPWFCMKRCCIHVPIPIPPASCTIFSQTHHTASDETFLAPERFPHQISQWSKPVRLLPWFLRPVWKNISWHRAVLRRSPPA